MSARSTKAVPSIAADFQLLPDVKKEGQADAFIPVRWCLSHEAVAEMDRQSATSAYMVLLVAANYGTDAGPEWRITEKKVVKLTAEMAYVRFNHAGANRLFGTIVWRTDNDWLKLSRSARNKIEIDRWNGMLQHRDFSADHSHLEFIAQVDVIVPPEMFAPEPPDIAKALVNRFFHDRALDQCHFRRRFLVSLVWLLPYIILTSLVRVIYGLAAAFIGLREVKWAALVRPIKYETGAIWHNVRRWKTWWNTTRNRENKNPLWWFLQPISYTVVWAIVLFISSAPVHYTGSKTHTHPAVGYSLLTCLLVSVFIHVVLLVLVGIGAGALALWEPLTGRSRKARRVKQERVNQTEHQRLVTELFTMACDTSTKRPSLNALPKQKRSIALRFNGTKKGVCRPYSH